jgi:Flp pilus assembly protein protease CpaA
MIYVEALMLSVMIYVGILASYSDIRYGIVKNKMLLMGIFAAIILDVIYYSFFAKGMVIIFIINTLALSLFSVLMYFYHIWAAGDSKLLIVEALLMPVGLYNRSGELSISSVSIVILIFSIAYVYIIFETIYEGLKRKNLFSTDIKIRWNKSVVVNFVKRYIQCMVYITLLNMIYVLVIPDIYVNNIVFFTLINLFFVLTVFRYRVFYKAYVFMPAVVLLCMTVGVLKINIFDGINYKVYLLLMFVMIFRKISEKYNYIEIPTSSVKAGMILSLETIILFKRSKVKGLPISTTEDMRSRISEDEAKSILRWEKSKYGEANITIVKKMPFAIFIILGVVSYLIIRMCIQ